MPTHSFYQVDVFSDEPTKGNPVAVVLIDPAASPGPNDEMMQSFSKWTNLSETTFLYPSTPSSSSDKQYDYELRIWTPGAELPFAGHPTLGSCKAFLDHTGRNGKPEPGGSREILVTQRCKIGDIKIRVDLSTGVLAFAAPPLIRSGPVDKDVVRRVCDAMKIHPSDVLDAQWVANGPQFFALRLDSAQAVLDIDYSSIGAGDVSDLIWGVFGPYEASSNPNDPKYEVRLFAPSIDVGEDPVTGSFNAGIATLLASQAEAKGKKPEDYVASQGTKLGRKGRVQVHYELDEAGKLQAIWVGGEATIVVEGKVTL